MDFGQDYIEEEQGLCDVIHDFLDDEITENEFEEFNYD